MNPLSETEKAYLAGFLDGEGCITILRQMKKKSVSISYALSVVIAQADLPILEELSSIIGAGKIYKYPGGYQLVFAPTDAKGFLLEILPYLKVKKAEALLAIEFRENTVWKNQGIGSTVDNETLKLREGYYIRMRELKHNGLNETRGRKKTDVLIISKEIE